ncbi:Structural maintenance of chromosomes protein 2 [Schistosoma japonicum]|nr:Structural maintenance of chromosomes protein 2 [Schistosoma japonicum]
MYIKSLVIDGFKSYCQRTEIDGFDPQFNAITGLNGSGKSNILDAICFLLGITNLSHVRAANLHELVYKCGQAGINKATVSAVFDNVDKSQSPYGYEQFDELTITKQIVVGGRNKYLINGTNATTTRVHDLFHSVQLNVNNPHFLIMQGRITKILNMKPPEILSLLEEAASTKLYENKKDAALKTIEKKDSKLREIDRILTEDISPTIKKLREERSSYLEYQKVIREINHLEKFIVAYDYTCLEEAKQRTKGDLVTLERSLDEQKANMDELRKSREMIESRIAELCKQRDEYQGAALEELESTMSACQKTEAVAKGASQRASESLRAVKQRVKSLQSQCVELDEQLSIKHKAAEAAAGVEYQAALTQSEEAKAKFEAAQKRLQAVKSGLSSGENGVAASLAEQARVADGEKCSAHTELSQLKMRQKHLQSELAKQEAVVLKTFGRTSMNGESKEEIKQKELIVHIEELTQTLTRAEADDRAVGSESVLSEQQLSLVKEARELRHQASTLSSQFPQLVFDYTDPEPNFDKRRVLGPVAKLFRVKDLKYAVALEVIAANKLQNIVVDTEVTAKILLERGQIRRRVTMLPLTQIRGNPIPDGIIKKVESLVGSVNAVTALSLIEYDDMLKPVMEYVFGNVLICPDMETAKRVAFYPGIEKKTVTLEGDVFDPQGTLSGGSRGTASDSLLSRIFRWRDVDAAAQRAEENVTRGEANVKAAQVRSRKISHLREALDNARHQLGLLETQMRQTDKHRLRADVAATKDELRQVEELLRSAEQRLTQASLKAKLAHEKATNAVAERKKEQEDAEKALTEAKNQVEITVTALREKNSLKESLRLETEELAKELNTLKLSLEEAIQSVEAAEVEEKRCIEASQLAKEALTKAREAVTHQRGLIDETVRLLAATEKQAGHLVQSLNQTNSLIDKLSHQIEMQTKESAEANSKMERLLETHPWIHEEKQHFGVENGAYCFTSRDPTETRKRIHSLKERCNRLSRSVNMRAMNMLGNAEKQYSELIRRQEIVLADKRKIQTVIDDLDKRKEEVLLSAYNKVNEEFCNIFATLLPGSKARLSPPDGMTVLDGLEIKVAFGDVWKESLGELSGGQRSLAALSLILALLLFKPAPLYILDEFIVVSLKDGMFNNANVLFKTKFVDGVSTVSRHVPLRVRDENKQPQTDRHRKRVK